MRDREAPLREHLEELRRRLFYVVISVAVATGVAFAFYQRVLEFLLLPGQQALERTGGSLVFTEVTETFAVTMKVSLVAGVVLSIPVILYHVIMFVAPGLTPRERRYLFTFLPGSLLAFAVGVAFGYFVFLPNALGFLITWGSDVATPMIRLGNYVNVVVMVLFWTGLVFETPLVMYLLSLLGIVGHRGFARFRKMWIVVAFILGAVITPTFDPINQSIVAGSLIVLFELGILLARLADRGRRRATAPGGVRG